MGLHSSTRLGMRSWQPWRMACVMGMGAGAPCSTQHITDKVAATPVAQLDHHYLNDDGEEAGETDE